MAQNLNYQQRVATAIKDRAALVAQAIAGQLGPPTDSVSLTPEQEAERWNLRRTLGPDGAPLDPGALLASGMPLEDVVNTVYPLRSRMVKLGRPDPKDQVAYAERMVKLSKKYGYPGYEDVAEDGE